jgi:Fur family zinc uptake transcriptional regulator
MFQLDPSRQAAMQQAQVWCQQSGHKLTPLRQQVYALLLNRSRPVKAYELLADLQQARGAAAPPTVYRALEFLERAGLVHRIDSLNVYVACRHVEQGHQALFLICDVCHCITEVCNLPLQATLDHWLRQEGFRPGQRSLEVRGLCSTCQTAPRDICHVA